MITFVGRRGVGLGRAVENGLDKRWFCHVATTWASQEPKKKEEEKGTG